MPRRTAAGRGAGEVIDVSYMSGLVHKLSVVMAGLVPAIHILLSQSKKESSQRKKDVDARNTSAFTRVFDALARA
jgi:hypothetical protein